MKTLEIAPLKGKKLRVLLVKKPYDEPWWVTMSPTTRTETILSIIQRPSIAYCEMIKTLAEKEKPDFATDELGMRSTKEFIEDNPLVDVFAKLKIPYRAVEMDEFARSHLEYGIEKKMEKRNDILNSFKTLSQDEIASDIEFKLDRLAAYGQYLQDEVEEEIRQVEFGVRESWIAMGILESAERLKKKRIIALHLCSPRHLQGLADLLQVVNVDVTSITFKRILEETPEETFRGMTDLTGISNIRVVPKVKRPKRVMQNILFFLEAEEYASPFDICVAYDAGFDVVVPYPTVSIDGVTTLVQDAIFSRGSKGVKHTCFFLGGRDVPQARKMGRCVEKAMVKPFVTSVVVDPHGAFTTSAAMVAKAEASLPILGLEPLASTSVLVLAGTGPVGETVAVLCAAAGAETVITSRKAERARKVAKRLSCKDYKINGIQAALPKEIRTALENATLVFAAGAPSVQLVSKKILEAVSANLILIDANAVPPSGIAGLGPSDDLREISPGKFGIGPLALGDLKLKVQREMLKEAREAAKGIYDDTAALRIAHSILEEQQAEGKLPEVKPLVATK